MSPSPTGSTLPAPRTPALPGQVTLAGAGPGDPELLTLKALRRIEGAQAIVYDALVGEGIRALFPAGAQLYPMGKRRGDAASATQADINALLTRLARQGLRVLRLKGGDPYVFGRGGEEALHLAAQGIPCEVIPGISAAQGASAAAGIPLTHRRLSGNCTVLNGHGPYLDEIDAAALVRLGGTWVFYMAKHSLQPLARRLLAAGADPALPIALVENATLPGQTLDIRTLGEAAAQGCPPHTDGPGLVIAGPTVALASELTPAALLAPLAQATPLGALHPSHIPEADGTALSDLP